MCIHVQHWRHAPRKPDCNCVGGPTPTRGLEIEGHHEQIPDSRCQKRKLVMFSSRGTPGQGGIIFRMRLRGTRTDDLVCSGPVDILVADAGQSRRRVKKQKLGTDSTYIVHSSMHTIEHLSFTIAHHPQPRFCLIVLDSPVECRPYCPSHLTAPLFVCASQAESQRVVAIDPCLKRNIRHLLLPQTP